MGATPPGQIRIIYVFNRSFLFGSHIEIHLFCLSLCSIFLSLSLSLCTSPFPSTLQSPALLQCLAQCSEVTPYLLVMEFCPLVSPSSSSSSSSRVLRHDHHCLHLHSPYTAFSPWSPLTSTH